MNSPSDVPETLDQQVFERGPLFVPGAVPERIGRYQMLRLLGKGGMGVVYLAEDMQLRRNVALKLPNFALDERPDTLERFYREARTAARLQHPNICPVYDVDQADGRHYLTMAFIDGQPLSQLVPDFPNRPPSEAVQLVRTVALALDEAHQQGIIHRDLKPANIMINRRGEPVVMDFGLAREIRNASAELSAPGVPMGTPAYMSPEQARGDLTAIGPGCDVYSLGVVLYQLLCGDLPFQGTTIEVMSRHLHDAPPPLSKKRPGIDPRLEAICLKAMEKEPSRRFLGMAELVAALDEFLRAPDARPDATSLQVQDPLEQVIAETLVLFRTVGREAGIALLPARLEKHQQACREEAALLLRWMQGQPEASNEAAARFQKYPQYSALAGWALVGEIFIANREHYFRKAHELLRHAAAIGDRRDNILQAEFALQRGFWLYHDGDLDGAAAALHDALDLCGRQHSLTGPVLDVLGMVYTNKNNFLAASECFEQSLQWKQRAGEDQSVARTYRHLGQFYLEWGELDHAENAFQKALEIALKTDDERAQANTFHYLGKLFSARGEREASAGRSGQAQRHWVRAAEWLDACIASNVAGARTVLEAHARRDRAILSLHEEKSDRAREHLSRAEAIFQEKDHEEGLARVREVGGMLARRQGRFAEARQLLRQALHHFDHIVDFLEAARTQLEIARTMAEAGDLKPLVVHEYLDAIKRAEFCRRTPLIRAMEEELRGVDEEALSQHVFERVRGRSGQLDTTSLDEGVNESVSVLFVNLRGFARFCHALDSGEVMRTVNQMMIDLSEVLERHRGFVTSYLGGGFMALVRGPSHAERAVHAALDMHTVVNNLNRPRAALGLRQLPVQISVASGSVFLGNIGTYQKMDFTAVGPTVNLAARLMRSAEEIGPCISQETYELVRHRFEFASGNPRRLDLRDIGWREVWDVLGLRKEPPA